MLSKPCVLGLPERELNSHRYVESIFESLAGKIDREAGVQVAFGGRSYTSQPTTTPLLVGIPPVREAGSVMGSCQSNTEIFPIGGFSGLTCCPGFPSQGFSAA